MDAKRVGILGSGDVGQALGRGFVKHGFEVKLGTRSPEKLAEWVEDVGDSGSVGSFADAAEFGDIVVLALNGKGAENALDLAGPAHFAGKLVLDATNPLDFSEGMPPHLFTGAQDSLGERIQAKLPDAHVVKCFNTVTNSQMIDPVFEAETPPMLICGNDEAAKAETDALLSELGWPGAFDMGDIKSARYLEALVPLWVRAGERSTRTNTPSP
ncbi:NADPH-dependent F420 reductase [Haladaptatus sp. GCM10025707]|uniref:NADPH-dependent F420 reductase n=1 Tax=unclassified Haladaptatus TaxID=2622732 RepID=UPI0036194F39